MTRKRKAVKTPKDNKKFKEYVDVEPDPNIEDYYYDEIDQFNMDKEKILLGDAIQPRKQKTVEEEIFPVGDDYDSEEDEEDIENMTKLMKLNRRLPSSKAALIAPNSFAEGEGEDGQKGLTWGRRKADKYGADVTEDFDISDSEENTALLEEKEALAIQKRQLEQLEESDFNFEIYKKQLLAVTQSGKQVQKDDSKLSLEEKRDFVKKENPELVPIYLDTIQKCTEVKKTLCPIVEAYKKGLLPKHELFDYLQCKMGLYFLHFTNTAFYRALKLKRVNTRNHPVIEAIFSYIEKFKKLKKIDQCDASAIRYVLKMLKKGKPELVTVQTLDQLLGKDSLQGMQEERKRVKFVAETENDAEDLPQKTKTNDEDRFIDYKIEKNKGITPKRKKANRNPRIKYKEKYRKALIRQRGQRPKPRNQLHPYAGELSGIRIGVKRGIKLKS